MSVIITYHSPPVPRLTKIHMILIVFINVIIQDWSTVSSVREKVSMSPSHPRDATYEPFVVVW